MKQFTVTHGINDIELNNGRTFNFEITIRGRTQ
jgi:hypothetical protein